ncbi:MAG: class I SAM-dependent methyltransferase [Ilumatobacteraceae bacterium]
MSSETTDSRSEHWAKLWGRADPTTVTWYQPHPTRQLELITSLGSPDDHVLDVGGGASTLVDGLLEHGYRHLAVLDISAEALEASRQRLGQRADHVEWIVGDVLEATRRGVDVWHDRAVFHFLIDMADRARYVEVARVAVRPGRHAVIATFGPDGPEYCSGLPVHRYTPSEIAEAFADGFELVDSGAEHHVSPTGVTQSFIDVVLRRTG